MKSVTMRNKLKTGQILWLLVLGLCLVGTLGNVSMADVTGPGNPPALPPDSIVDTSGTSSYLSNDDPTLSIIPDDAAGLDASMLYDLLLLSLTI